jgi:cation:H+ antiporter
MALMNMVSSNINQWTILAAMIPLVYGFSHLQHHGDWASFTFDAEQRLEIVLTLLQTLLGAVILAELEFDATDAAALFVLWLAQFLVPHLREEVAVAYGLWIMALLVAYAVGKRPLLVPRYFWAVVTKKTNRPGSAVSGPAGRYNWNGEGY